MHSSIVRDNVSRLPLWVGMGYLLLTFLLFFIGPYDFPVWHTWVYFYVPIVFLALAGGHLLGTSRTPVHRPLIFARRIYIFGAIAAAILIVPSGRVYAGRWPWEVLEALADQKGAYQMLREQLVTTEGTRGPLAFLRSAAAPFTFAVVPLAVLHWRQLGSVLKLLLFTTVACSLIFSILRGTTRELADTFIVGGSAFLVSAARQTGRSFVARHWKRILLGFVLAAAIAATLVGRTQARLGDTSAFCMGRSGVCADLYSPPYGEMSDSTAFGAATLTAYLSQGYYGLALAMEQPFLPTWGLGHSPAVEGLYRSLTESEDIKQRTYTFRNSKEGWSDESQWSTLLVWLANDLSFWGVPVFIALLGLLWGRTWIDATKGKDDWAAIFFCALMMVIFYLPANNQMMATFDNYTVLAGWGLAWGASRHRGVALPAALRTAPG